MILSILLGFLCISSSILIFQDRIGRNGSSISLISLNILSFGLISLMFLFGGSDIFGVSNLMLWWNSLSLFTNYWGFYVDKLSYLFMLTILFISTLIMIYAISYMYTDMRVSVFISYLGYFVFFMLLLILSNNLIQMFIGWEGVGVVSFLLVNFWFTRLSSNKGALKALIFNRVGDVGFIIAISLFCKCNGLLSIPLFNLMTTNTSLLAILFILLAAAGKSAQLILYAWLPDAMEGPTPVSALLHSATMVTAGIFLLLRMSSYIQNTNSFIMILLLTIGLFTSICSGLFALTKYDIKKIIAFSTCSQLGLLVCGIALGLIPSTFFHLFIHAFFKALLFLASGVIIHALIDEQDIRKYGNVVDFMSFFIIVNCIGTLNIIGFPYMSGFYSKETLVFYPFITNSLIFKSAIFLSSIITILYSLRLFSKCCTNESLVVGRSQLGVSKIDPYILFTLSILASVSIISGYFFADSISSLASMTFSNIYSYHLISIDIEVVQYTLFYSIIFITIYLIMTYVYITQSTFNLMFYFCAAFMKFVNVVVQEFFLPMLLWSLAKVYNYVAYRYVLQCLEKGVLEYIGLVNFYNIILHCTRHIFHSQLRSIFYEVAFIALIVISIIFMIAQLDIFSIQLLVTLMSIHIIHKTY